MRFFGQRGKLNNLGISLVELLVVIAIMSVMTGIVGLSVYMARSRDCEKCAKEIDTRIERARMFAMSKNAGAGTYELQIDCDNNQTYLTVADETNKLQQRVTITMMRIGADGSEGLEETVSSIGVGFDPSTGRLSKLSVDGSALSESDFENIGGLKIKCANDDRDVFVTVIKNTGKHYVTYD